MISLVSPIYNSSKIIHKFVKYVVAGLKKTNKKFEIILIDDCSKDDSWKKLLEIKKIYKNIKIYRNKKNIGQYPTIKKALKRSKGDLIFFLDSDLQDDPKYFKNFLNLKKNNKIAIFGVAKKNSEISKGIISEVYWFVFRLFTRINYPSSVTTFP